MEVVVFFGLIAVGAMGRFFFKNRAAGKGRRVFAVFAQIFADAHEDPPQFFRSMDEESYVSPGTITIQSGGNSSLRLQSAGSLVDKATDTTATLPIEHDLSKDWNPDGVRGRGQIRGRRLVLAHLTFNPNSQHTTSGYVLLLRADIPPALGLIVEIGEGFYRWLDAVGIPLDTRDPETGDRGFDQIAYMSGSLIQWMARLKDETRALLRNFLISGGILGQGHIISFNPDGETLEQAVKNLEILADALELSEPLPAALVQNAEQSEHPQFRRRCTELSLDTYPAHPATRRLAESLIDTDDTDLWLQAAPILGSKALGSLITLAIDDSRDRSHRLRAIAALGSMDPKEASVSSTLETVLSQKVPELGNAALEAMGKLRVKAPYGHLSAAIEWADIELGVLLAEHIARQKDPRVETDLLRLLKHEETAVAIAAAEQLKTHGTVDAVHPLMERDNSVMNFELKFSLREALSAVRFRIGKQETGRLSLVDEENAGGLSITQTDDDPPGNSGES